MKIILSHDVDHIHGLDHWKDRYWPGVWYRGSKSWLGGKISMANYLKRSWPLQRLERIKEVLDIDRSVGAVPTFFFGMRNGLRLSYNPNKAKPLLRYLLDQEIPVGIHGMAYDDLALMKEEYDTFCRLAGVQPAGIRNHYLRQSEKTTQYQSDIGYAFDSTVYGLQLPYQVNGMWEFPISLMDVSLGIDTTLEHKKKQTMAIYEQATEMELPYFVLNFHDLYYSESYPSLLDWYAWFLQFLATNHSFTYFSKAIENLGE